ncbi:hypothetical protein EJ07DRAFT_156687 [Lizonia empirigonia]|nr:hypothetical protein EJ07DRAFT_156687 [Lizonia empirigonia]
MAKTFTTTATTLGSSISTVSPLLAVAVLLLASSMTAMQRLVTATSRHSRHPYDTQGYSRECAYGGEESLRHRLGREGRESHGYLDESRYNELDPRTRVGRDDRSRSGYASGHRSGLSQQIYTDDYEEHRQTRRGPEQSQVERQLQAEHEREARRAARYTSSSSYASHVDNPYARSSRDGSRRGVGTAATDPYLAYSEALRAAEQETEYDSGTPRGRGIGRWQYR